ncbi:SAM-dependent methyltransferase [Lysobacter niastensis]|uniref:SAM-dependent methyltransferase n=1 Tax=Lysobacter niastensis TaxID=380629 RepID=A0ABU1WC78_9GAMM|nr:methyltransferase domain-containing protein [Lysobacter niastensis]MDR7135213.1 SAM-dependent methyltransferase [Lysobacter niastensis]
MEHINTSLDRLYRHRFSDSEVASKKRIWQVLCRQYFSKFVPADARVVDLGAGYCEFINHIDATDKIAIDLNPDTMRFAAPGVRVINESCTNVASVPSDSVDAVFMSNFLEHLPSKQLVLDTLRETARMLRPGGRAIILQPNIRFLPGEYWDYFDHHTPLTDRSLVEAVVLAGLEPEEVVPRFLPYTTKSRLPQAPWLVSLYLRIPLVWRVLGKQALVVARKPR